VKLLRTAIVAGALALAGIGSASAQTPPAKSRAELLAAARAIMDSARFASFVTVDEQGQPQSRIVDPFAPDSDFTIWIGTNPRSRKVAQVQKSERVALSYFDHARLRYVTLLGRADVVTDDEAKRKYFKPEWAAFYPDRTRDYVLLRIRPERLELISESDGIGFTDFVTWRPPAVTFD
jgi:general stress protein 26